MYKSDVEAMDAFVEKYKALNSEIGKVIVGQMKWSNKCSYLFFLKVIVYWLEFQD